MKPWRVRKNTDKNERHRMQWEAITVSSNPREVKHAMTNKALKELSSSSDCLHEESRLFLAHLAMVTIIYSTL
jgi:hypothetical protein